MSRLTEMEAFATVVEQGGFSDAARKMGVAKSTVSKHVAALEQRLGVRLLSRTTRRVSPTEIGMAYYDRATRILNDAGEADALVAALHGVPSGVLRLSVASDFGALKVTPLLPRFLAEFPDISVNMTLQDGAPDLIEDGFDLGLRIGTLADSSLMSRKITAYSTLMVASPAYLEDAGSPRDVAALCAHRLLARSDMGGSAAWTVRTGDGNRQVQAAAALSVNDGPSLLTAALAGLGIAQLPDFLCAEAVADGRLVQVLPDLPPQTVCVHAIYPPGRFTQPKVRAFIDFLVARFAGAGQARALRFCETGPESCRSTV